MGGRVQTNRSSRAKLSSGAMRSWARLRSEKESCCCCSGTDGRQGRESRLLNWDLSPNQSGSLGSPASVFLYVREQHFFFQHCFQNQNFYRIIFAPFWQNTILEGCYYVLSIKKKEVKQKSSPIVAFWLNGVSYKSILNLTFQFCYEKNGFLASIILSIGINDFNLLFSFFLCGFCREQQVLIQV